jgi:hypothetical protein
MTRKRYTKLLMALGIPRNIANADAKDCQRQKLEYHKEAVSLRRFLIHQAYMGLRVPVNFLEVLPYE